MLADKILKIAMMKSDYDCYKELQKMGIDIDNKIWKEYASIYAAKQPCNRAILIRILCENEIRDTARKTTLKPTTKKRIKAIEKFLDKNKKTYNTKARPVFHHYFIDEGNLIYTNMHMLGVIKAAEVEGINEQYNIKNIDGVFPDYKKVIPELKTDCKTATIDYGTVLAQNKKNKADKVDLDIIVVKFDENNYSAYNTNYLLHCFEVLGTNELTLKRNSTIECKNNTIECENSDNEPTGIYTDTTIVTAEGTESYMVLCGCRITKDYISKYLAA
jgi:hypothetical protein